MKDYRFSLPRKQSISEGEKHWFEKNKKISGQVLDLIKAEGPLQAKDFESKKSENSGWWEWKPAKKALEQLYMEGELMIVKRQGFSKVYDLTERVLPDGVITKLPGEQEYCEHLIQQYLKANAFAKIEQISYLRKGLKKVIQQQCKRMLSNKQLITLKINHELFYALPLVFKILEKKISYPKINILCPFDNLVIQRKRLKNIFDFDYQIESYMPAEKRRYGYFSLPLLWGTEFAGRMDVKMERKLGILTIHNLVIETQQIDEFLFALKPALREFMLFNNGLELNVLQISSPMKKFSKVNQKKWARQLMIE